MLPALAETWLPGERGWRGERVLIVVVLSFNVEDQREGLGMQPGWRENVCASLAFEEQRKPEGKSGSAGWEERFDRALRKRQITTNSTTD